MIRWNRAALDRLQTDAAQRLLDGVGRAAEDLAVMYVPVRTGRLRDSIAYEPIIYGKEARLIAYAPYAAFVELGTSRAAAQPYLRPAVFQAIDEVLTNRRG